MQTSNSGQAVVSILITLLIGMTIALGIYLGSLSGSKITTTHDDSEQAFNAADAGIEEMLRKSANKLSGMASTNLPVGSLNSLVNVGQESSFNLTVAQNDAVTIPLRDNSGNVTATGVKISWTREGSDCTTSPSLLIARWKNDNTITYYARDPRGCSHNPPAVGFTNTDVGTATAPYTDSFEITDLNSNDLFLRIRPIYNQSTIKVEATAGILPTQQFSITSNVTMPGSNESRAIKATKTVPDLPSIFDYAVFSGNAIMK